MSKKRKQFEQKCSEYRSSLERYLLSLTHNKEQAEEITQETLLRYWKNREAHKWEGEVMEIAYMKTTAKHLLYELWDARRIENAASADNEQDERLRKDLASKANQINNPVARIEDSLDAKKIFKGLPWKAILRGVSKEDWELFRLNVIDGLLPKEIAREQGKDAYQVSWRINKVKAIIRYRVKEIIKKRGQDEKEKDDKENNGGQEKED
jgi:RNA polymerase sigma factor (sigma-70 family)